jgi:histone H3/H4
MAEPEKKPAPEEKKEEKPVKEEKEEAKKSLIYFSRVRVLLKGTYEGQETKLNISKDARMALINWLEELISSGLTSLVKAMPTKTKGEQEGQLSRKTVKKGDITRAKRVFKESFAEVKKKGKKK